MPADLKRLHKYMLDIQHIDHISDEMRAVVESEWPELVYKLPAAEGIGTLWACSCRMLREEPLARSRCLPSGAPSKLPQTRTRGFPRPRPTSLWTATLGRGSRWGTNPLNRRGRGGD